MAWPTKTYVMIGVDDADVPADAQMCFLLHITAVEPLTAGRLESK
ncbi:MAG: hypothetical protein ACRC1K_07225 [Planctomycetia bacterium]